MRPAFLSLVLLLALVSCRITNRVGGSGGSGAITFEEMQSSGLSFGNAYEIVQQFRPSWLRTRGISIIQPQQGTDATLLDYVGVYVDGTFLGGPETLRGVSVLTVARIEHFDRGRAQSLGSRSHIHGAIVVHTRKR